MESGLCFKRFGERQPVYIGPVDFDGLLNTGLKNLMNIERLYKKGDIVKKREIIGSMYPENLTIDGFGVHRNALFNWAPAIKKASHFCEAFCDPDWIRTNDLLLSLPATGFPAPDLWSGFVVWTISSPFQVCHV